MKVFIAALTAGASGANGTLDDLLQGDYDFYCLETFFDARKPYHSANRVAVEHRKFRGFLLDSGAFSYLSKNKSAAKKSISWDAYIDEYAQFIVANGIEHFFELDIDPIVGLQEVIRLRNRLHSMTGRRCIPVWHLSRGGSEWERYCNEYDYVAIGGFVTGEIAREGRFLEKMIARAVYLGTKVHGLGLGSSDLGFYSIDSSSWCMPLKFGTVTSFDGDRVSFIRRPEGKRVVAPRIEVARRCLETWKKFSNRMEMR